MKDPRHQSGEFDRYDRLAEMVANPPSDHSALTALAAEIVADLRSRNRALELANPPTTAVRRAGDWHVLHRTQDEILGSVLGLVALSVISQNLRVALPVLAVVVSALALRSMRRRKAQDAAISLSLRSESCRDCEYNLTGLPNSIPHEWIAAHVGPRRCPECGEPWPRVPRTV